MALIVPFILQSLAMKSLALARPPQDDCNRHDCPPQRILKDITSGELAKLIGQIEQEPFEARLPKTGSAAVPSASR